MNRWHHTLEACECIRQGKLGDRNPMWRGDNVGLAALHDWVKDRKLKPSLCDCCHSRPPDDLSNISQEYKRDLDDWEWLCRKCHMTKDGRMNNLVQFQEGNVVQHPTDSERRYEGGRWKYLLACVDCGKKRWIDRTRMIRPAFANRCHSCEDRKRWLENGHL